MGREFVELFEDWSAYYDDTVEGQDPEYKEAFEGYHDILDKVADKSLHRVLEFGVGTGNLTAKLLKQGKTVYGIEPSEPMRKIALKKLGDRVQIQDGDFLHFPLPPEPVDTIVSTYAFHHLTDEEKAMAIASYARLLEKGGKIVFADTVFEHEDAHLNMIEEAMEKGFHTLAEDLRREYYTTIGALTSIFEENGFSVTFERQNKFVWLMEAVKQ